MDRQKTLRSEIVSTAQRILARLNEIQSSCDSDQNHEFAQKSEELMNLFSSLEHEKSQSLLVDVAKWNERRQTTFHQFDAPLFKQMEENQSITGDATAYAIPKLQSQMNQYQGRLSMAQSQLQAVSEEVVRAAEGFVLASGGRSGTDASPHLQLEATPMGSVSEANGMRPEDEELIKQMRLREEHLLVVVSNLRGELKGTKAELSQSREENAKLMAENDELTDRVAVLESKGALDVGGDCVCDLVRPWVVAVCRELSLEIPEVPEPEPEISKAELWRNGGGQIQKFSVDIAPSVSADAGKSEKNVSRAAAWQERQRRRTGRQGFGFGAGPAVEEAESPFGQEVVFDMVDNGENVGADGGEAQIGRAHV
jgi:hypothetical protein